MQTLLAAVCSGALWLNAAPATAADGDLDPVFGIGGQVRTDFFGFDGAFALAIQADGKTVAAGFAMDANFEPIVALIRYQTDGTPDPTFGNGGKVAVELSNDLWGKVDVAIQGDGKIVVASTVGSFTTDYNFGLVRFEANGNPDLTFGTGGKVITDFGAQDEATSVAIQSDGKIVVAGVTGSSVVVADFAVARYLSDGQPDGAFGVGGKLTTDFFGSADRANDVAIQSDGKIVAVGAVMDPGFNRFFGVARYNSDGTLDATFSGGGKVTTAFLEFTEANAVLIQQTDGKIVVAGSTFIGVPELPFTGWDFALARYHADGTPDAAFGFGGKLTTDAGGFEQANAVTLQSDGKIVAVGSRADLSDVEIHQDFALARYGVDGTLDATFGNGGFVITDFQFTDVAGGVVLQPDCQIVVAGYSWPVDTGNSDFALARYDSSGCVIEPPTPTFECPLSHGHWKNNPGMWPVSSLTVGSQTYSKAELLVLLSASSQTDASLILARQLIAAKLNLANGSDPTPVASVVASGDSLLAAFSGKLPYQVKSSAAVGQAMVAAANVLTSYNNGLLTPACVP